MDHGQVKKPRISQGKPVRWPDMGFGHLTPADKIAAGSSAPLLPFANGTFARLAREPEAMPVSALAGGEG
jgi:hypothetical protein